MTSVLQINPASPLSEISVSIQTGLNRLTRGQLSAELHRKVPLDIEVGQGQTLLNMAPRTSHQHEHFRNNLISQLLHA